MHATNANASTTSHSDMPRFNRTCDPNARPKTLLFVRKAVACERPLSGQAALAQETMTVAMVSLAARVSQERRAHETNAPECPRRFGCARHRVGCDIPSSNSPPHTNLTIRPDKHHRQDICAILVNLLCHNVARSRCVYKKQRKATVACHSQMQQPFTTNRSAHAHVYSPGVGAMRPDSLQNPTLANCGRP